ncbi:hypothetical protein SQ03_06540 [Methylobacterium platani JCM 14648]|uniref:Response regulatory domain-containing protein n=2 Tax=Methylobacterium platani TaxID=427683 RepID=A0A179S9V4_9HYPH|nr:hypothetical protein SQ03_06540 [Methylobacterium platani JCM 14648]OAS22763.1 hypothetical protein A5481_18065 [Methylobacterium platani]
MLVVEDLEVGRFATRILADLGYATTWTVIAEDARDERALAAEDTRDERGLAAEDTRDKRGLAAEDTRDKRGLAAEDARDERGPDGAGFDALFSDVVMPGMGGIALAWVLAQENADGLELPRKPCSAERVSRVLREVMRRAPRHRPAGRPAGE